MKRKKTIILALILAILSNYIVLFKLPVTMPEKVTLKIEMESTQAGVYQFFYAKDGIFDIAQSQSIAYGTANEKVVLAFSVPVGYDDWRIDFGDSKATVKVYSMKMSYHGKEIELKDKLLEYDSQTKGLGAIIENGDNIIVETTENDPQEILNFEEGYFKDIIHDWAKDWCLILNIIVCAAIDIILFVFCLMGYKIIDLFKELVNNKKLIMNLAKNDFKTKYVGSYLGIVWAFIQPTVTIVVYWFVFQVGLRSGNVGDFPFILWLIAGLVPWFFFSEALGAGTSSLMEYQYLVKKVVFKISILPVVKVISALFVHLFFMAITVLIYSLYGYTPDVYTLQIIYYTFCTFVLSLGIIYFTSSIVIFFRDTSQIVNVFLQIGIWMTPIMWQISILPDRFLWIFKTMPMYYIVMGYRDSLINKVWFWEKIYETAWFWGCTIVLFGIGTMVFKKLKVHFADVL